MCLFVGVRASRVYTVSAAILRFSHSKWSVLDSEKKTPIKAESPLKGVCEFPYDQVDKLVMRARPQHMDVRYVAA